MYKSADISTYLVWRRHFSTEKILSSCGGRCIAKEHILFFPKVNKCNFFTLNLVKYFIYFIHTNQAAKLAANSQRVLSEGTDDHA